MNCHLVGFGKSHLFHANGPKDRNAILRTGEYKGLAFLSQAADAGDLVILHGEADSPEPFEVSQDAKLVMQDEGYPRIWIGMVESLLRFKKGDK